MQGRHSLQLQRDRRYDAVACTQGTPANLADTTNSIVPTEACMDVQETFCHRLVEIKVRFLKATGQEMLVQQNQACCVTHLNDSSSYMTYTSRGQHITELWLG